MFGQNGDQALYAVFSPHVVSPAVRATFAAHCSQLAQAPTNQMGIVVRVGRPVP